MQLLIFCRRKDQNNILIFKELINLSEIITFRTHTGQYIKASLDFFVIPYCKYKLLYLKITF